MYSIVLLATLTTTAETPNFGDFWAKHCFWEDCYPARYGWVSCGYGHQPYYPTAYYGCGCGYQWNRWPTSCYGCGGACHGCGGYSAGCGGCYGGGCYGGVSSCMGHTCYGCYGGFSGFGLYNGVGYSGFGAYGNFGMYNTVPYYSAPMYTTPNIETRPSDYRPNEIRPLENRPLEIRPLDIVPKRTSNSDATPASVVIKVPAKAKVFIDNNLMKSAATERTYTSPPLAPGEAYFYTLRVVIEKDGKEAEEVRKVTVRAGEVSRLSFDPINDNVRPHDRTIVDASKTPIK